MRHVHTVVEHRDPGMADQPPGVRERFIVERQVEHRRREIGAERTADLHRAHRPPARRAAADVVHQLAQRDAEPDFEQSAVPDIARKLHGHRPARAAEADIRISRRPFGQDEGDGGKAQHIVDDGRPAEQSGQRGQRRLGADLAALALDTVEQRGLLAADIGARADAHLQREGSDTVRSQRDGPAHRLHRERIFAADIDIAVRRAHGVRGDRHAFDQAERVAFHQHPVGESAAVALVGVADDIFGTIRRIEHRLPLDPGGKARAAAPAQPAGLDGIDHRLRRGGARNVETEPPAMRRMVGQAERVDDAAARESETLLRREERQRRDIPEPGRVRPVQHRADIARTDGTIADAPVRRFDFDQRLDTEQPARTRAHHLAAGVREGARDLVGAQRDRRHVAADEDPRHADSSAAMRSSLASSSRATGRPSTSAFGPIAHRPRQ